MRDVSARGVSVAVGYQAPPPIDRSNLIAWMLNALPAAFVCRRRFCAALCLAGTPLSREPLAFVGY
jgi:hypothetical protein